MQICAARYVYFALLIEGMNAVPKHRILVAPLDWGLGHATRCAPLIDRWLAAGHEVILASNGRSAAWLKERYPTLELLLDIPDYCVTYPTRGSMTLHFAKHFLRLRKVVQLEQSWLQRIVQEKNIHQVCSDNRYGLYHHDIPCSIITHQLNLRVPFLLRWSARKLLNQYLQQFRSVWVPDHAGSHSLSGALSHGGKRELEVQFIGPLSRFQPAISDEGRSDYQVVALISGPEPARSNFEQLLRTVLEQLHRPALLVLGLPGSPIHEQKGMLQIVNHLSDIALANALRGSKLIICRSGYSTIMDLHALDVKALLVPTPEQTEQEYLARYHAHEDKHRMVEQKRLSLEVIKTQLEQ